MGLTQSRFMEANREARARVRAAGKALEGDDRQTNVPFIIVGYGSAFTFKNACISLLGKALSELRDVTCHIGSHRVTCHPTQVNTAKQAGRPTRRDRRLSLPGWLVISRWLSCPQTVTHPGSKRA